MILNYQSWLVHNLSIIITKQKKDTSRTTTVQRLKIVPLFYRDNNSVRIVDRFLREDYGQFTRPSEQTIGNIVLKFGETTSIGNRVSLAHHRGVGSAKKIAGCVSVPKEALLLNNLRSNSLGFSFGSLWGILHTNLHRHLYKMQVLQDLSPEIMNSEQFTQIWC